MDEPQTKSLSSKDNVVAGSENASGDATRTVPLLTAEGLEVLESTETIFIQVADDFPSGCTPSVDVPINRRYNIMDVTGEVILVAGEVIDYRSRCWRGMQRRYCMYIFSIEGQLLLTSERQKVRCCTRSPPVQEAESANYYSEEDEKLNTTRVHLVNGDFIGQIRDFALYTSTPKFFIDDETRSNIISIRGKSCGNVCTTWNCKNDSFQLLDKQHNSLGKILKTMTLRDSGSVKYCFGAMFPAFLPPVTKVLLIAAAFDLNVSYFERRCATNLVLYIVQLILVIFCVIGSIVFLLWAMKLLPF